MAIPIAPTPVLEGKDADEFARKMFEPPTEEEIEYMKKTIEMFKNHNPLEKNSSCIYIDP